MNTTYTRTPAATAPSTSELIYEAKKESSRLRWELYLERSLRSEGDKFKREMEYAFEQLRMAVLNHEQRCEKITAECKSLIL